MSKPSASTATSSKLTQRSLGTPAKAGKSTLTPLQLRQAAIAAGSLWFSFTSMEGCPVEKGPDQGPSLPCGKPATGEVIRCQSVLSPEPSEDLQVKVCTGCSNLTGASALIRAFPRGHINVHKGRTTSVVPLTNTAVYDRFRALSEEDFTQEVLAGVPRLCINTFPTVGDAFDYIGVKTGEPDNSGGSQGSNSPLSEAHPTINYLELDTKTLLAGLRGVLREAESRNSCRKVGQGNV